VTWSPATFTDVGDTDLTNLIAGAGGMVTAAADGGEVTAGPDGGVPETVAVFVTSPAFTSACVTAYVAVQVVDPPGASVVTGHEITGGVPVPENAVSVTATPVSVTLPVLVTPKLYVTRSPATFTDVGDTDLTNVIAGAAGNGVLALSLTGAGFVTPAGEVAVTVAVLFTRPAFTSACVTVYVAVHVVDAPAARLVTGHDTGPTLGSATASVDKVTPLDSGLVTANV
jgi:hypothetical protein